VKRRIVSRDCFQPRDAHRPKHGQEFPQLPLAALERGGARVVNLLAMKQPEGRAFLLPADGRFQNCQGAFASAALVGIHNGGFIRAASEHRHQPGYREETRSICSQRCRHTVRRSRRLLRIVHRQQVLQVRQRLLQFAEKPRSGLRATRSQRARVQGRCFGYRRRGHQMANLSIAARIAVCLSPCVMPNPRDVKSS